MKYAQYFFIAALSTALAQTAIPASSWEWWRFVGGSILAGVIATKALQSNPNSAPEEVIVTNTKSNPVNTEETPKIAALSRKK